MWLSLLSVLANKRQAVWDTDLKAVRGGSSVRQTGLLLGDPLFSKELENMGRQLAGRLYVCLLLHVWLCCICVCQLKLMIITTGKSDQMEFWKIKQVHTHTYTHSVMVPRHENALLSLNFSGLYPKSHFPLGMASVLRCQIGLLLRLSLICLMSGWLRDSHGGIRRQPGWKSPIYVCTPLVLSSGLMQTTGGLFALPLRPFEGLHLY